MIHLKLVYLLCLVGGLGLENLNGGLGWTIMPGGGDSDALICLLFIEGGLNAV